MMDPDESRLLNEAVTVLAEERDGAALTSALDAFGWAELLEGHHQAAISAVFGAQGRAGTWSSALHDVLASDLVRIGLPSDPTCCVLLPWPRSSLPGLWRAGQIEVRGLLLEPRYGASNLLIPVGDGDGSGVRCVVSVRFEELQLQLRVGLDRALGAREVIGTLAAVAAVADGDTASNWWALAEAKGRLALSHQMIGGLFVAIEMARSHVTARTQFGRLVGTFQAVRHKLVEAYVATAAADCAASAAWEADQLPLAAMTAKVVASKAVNVGMANTQQLLAGIGFTAEHPYHRYMKRVTVLDRVLGSGSDLAPLLGGQLISVASAPRLFEL
jgi:hypothetical protein